MFKIYLKTAWRNIKKNKSFFALNFFGLYISLVACILIMLVILHETSFDNSTNNGIKVYRVVSQNTSSSGKSFSGITQYPLASAMRVSMQDEKLISQIHFQNEDVVTLGNKKFKEQNIIFADSVFPRLFSLTLKEGSLQRALSEPGYAILTEKTANRFFGTEDPVGKRIKLANYLDLEVAAVVADAPSNSHLPYNMLVSYQSLTSRLLAGMPLNQWGVTSSGYTYIGLSDDNRTKNIESILASIASTYIPKDKPDFIPGYKLQPLSDIHYNQLYAGSNVSYTINYSYLYLMGVIGLFLILAACINYTNLSTALAIKKSKEVGVRKTMGATRPHLMKQFFSETFLFTAVVILAAALSIRPLLPHLNSFLDKNISLNWLNFKSGLFLLCLWAAVSLLSGVYPALILSGFNPITSLKTKMSAPKASVIIFRRGLVIFQFLTAQILIIGTLVVAKQMAFIQATPLGFSKQKVLDIDLPENKPVQLQVLRDQLSGIAGISSFSLSLGAPISDNRVNTDFNLKEKYAAEKLGAAVKATDKGYLQTFGLQLAAGRWFDDNDERQVAASIPDSLRHYSIVLSESAVKSLGFASPRDVLGKYVTFGINDISAPVIGVIKDFHVTSLHKAVSPVLMVDLPFFYYDAGIKLSGGYTASVLSAIEKAFTTTYPDALFQFGFLDEHIAQLYKEEKKTEQLFDIFAFLSIVINALGLIGLLSFVIEQKTKEIGIRKVLGASVSSISLLLSKDFLRLILISFFIAAPVAWYIMNQWLQGFAYRTQISWWVFAATLAGALFITFMSIGAQTIRAAFTNPIKSLRSE